jgi:hypothetical protein
MMSWDIRVTQSDTPRVATAASVASTVRERERQTEVCAAAAAEKTKREREREKRGAQVWSPGSWVGTLLGLPILRPRFVISFLHVFLEKILTTVSESGQVGRAPIETSFLSSRFSRVSRKRFSLKSE